MLVCFVLFVSVFVFGQGKMLVMVGFVWLYCWFGCCVCVFKIGFDFFDLMLFEWVSGVLVYVFDFGMVGEVGCWVLFVDVVCDVDLILIEGVMGLFDGMLSSVDFVVVFGVLVVVVILVKVMVQMFVVIVFGFVWFWFGLLFYGVLVNCVGLVWYVELL